MFFHIKETKYFARPECPDPVFAKKLQEILGGKHGEMTVAVQYLFQGWNLRGDGKYRDLLLDTGTEELAHVEMLVTMIARLLDDAPVEAQDEAAKDPFIEAVLGGMNPQHYIVAGLGALPADSTGHPWNGRYIDASGNLLADFRSNLTKESHGRLQTARLYEATDDRGVKDMLSFLIARDTMHQNQWAAAIYEMEEREGLVVPGTFPKECEKRDVSYTFFNLSRGEKSSTGRWAFGPSMDGCGEFEYVAHPQPMGEKPYIKPAPPFVHDTPPEVMKGKRIDPCL